LNLGAQKHRGDDNTGPAGATGKEFVTAATRKQ
jgi:hypothetical protein